MVRCNKAHGTSNDMYLVCEAGRMTRWCLLLIPECVLANSLVAYCDITTDTRQHYHNSCADFMRFLRLSANSDFFMPGNTTISGAWSRILWPLQSLTLILLQEIRMGERCGLTNVSADPSSAELRSCCPKPGTPPRTQPWHNYFARKTTPSNNPRGTL